MGGELRPALMDSPTGAQDDSLAGIAVARTHAANWVVLKQAIADAMLQAGPMSAFRAGQDTCPDELSLWRYIGEAKLQAESGDLPCARRFIGYARAHARSCG